MFWLCSKSAIPGGRRWDDKGRRAGLGLRLVGLVPENGARREVLGEGG